MNREEGIKWMVDNPGKELKSNVRYKYSHGCFCYLNTESNIWHTTIHFPQSFEIYTPKPKDKELCWCWDDTNTARRILSFYDAKNNSMFNYRGTRDSYEWDNVVPVKPEEMIGYVKEFYEKAFPELED